MRSYGARLQWSLRQGMSLTAVSAMALMLGACASMNDEGISASSLVSSHVTGSTGRDQAGKRTDSSIDSLTLARRLKADGQKLQAAEVLGDALSRAPDNRELLGEQGRLLLDLGEVDKAAELLALADDPKSPDWRVLSARGTVLAKQGRYGEAQAFYQRANSLAPDEPSVLNNLALIHAANGDAETAVRMLKQALARSADPRTQKNLELISSLAAQPEQLKTAAWGTRVQAVPEQIKPLRTTTAAAKPVPAQSTSPAQLRRNTTN